ncbi:MAG TPA: hypothetical protein VNO32_23785, partial [Candidatus Acidoferrum sp.]|nr:hypothetical protein [Candidatus Acidoferrum sp.]
PRAFLYQDGVMTDLNTLLQPSSSLHLVLANDINDRGEIVGFATDASGATVAFLAVPVDGDTRDDRAAARAENNAAKVIVPHPVRQMSVFGRFVGESQ